MNKRFYFYFGVAVIAILSIFLFVPTKKKKTQMEDVTSNQINKGLSIEEYYNQFISRQQDSIKAICNQLEANIVAAKDSLSKVNAFSESIEFYNEREMPELAAWQVYRKASVVQNTNSWKLTGDNFLAVLADKRTDTTLLLDIARLATESFQKSVDLDSNNIDSKLQLAQCYMELGNEPMKGVQLLLGIVRKDSTQLKAQLLLAKFGLMSGQYEKVLQRLENVLSLQPQNRDALLMRAEAYAQTGKNQLAAKDLMKVRSDKSTPSMMKSQLDVAIKELESKK